MKKISLRRKSSSSTEIWDTLRIAHEGSRGVRESKIELLEGKLGRFVMEDDETPQEMYDRMMIIVNKIRGLGSEDMTDHVVVKRLLQKFLRKKSYGRKDEDRYKRQSKKTCYECKEFGHFIADCPKLAKNKKGKGKTKYFKKRPRRAHIGEEWFSSDNESDKEEEPKSSDSKSKGVATMAISSSSTERLFSNLSDDDGDHTPLCLMVQGRKEGSLERQEDLLIQERIKNDSLEKALARKDEKLVDLSKELTLANQTITNLKNVNEILEETIVSMNVRHNGLENEIDNLKHSLSKSKDNTIVTTILDCEKYKTIDLSVVETNNVALKELKKENERLETLVKFGCIRTYQSNDALFKTITSYNNKDKRGLGYSPDSNASPKRVMINGKPCVAFVKKRESTAEEDTKISPEDRQSE
ncbi:uncharacterized protein LOC121054419 [Oryza brachyantha]|uniref:uncharacterized protein LOC121054419 n=1 Tax=Oryza brachyantha TaxID=4533 RepID=UPI001ADC7915|nr:uncharacterized protein LOC121054419 [Oryza brachyantha]